MDCPRRTSEQIMMMMMVMVVSIALKTLPIFTSGGPGLDREPEHRAGRQQEAVHDEWRDRPPLLLDEDHLRAVRPELRHPRHSVQVREVLPSLCLTGVMTGVE